MKKILLLCSLLFTFAGEASFIRSPEVHFNVELKSRTGKKEQVSKAFFKVKNNAEFTINQERTGLRIVFIPRMLKVLTRGMIRDNVADVELDAKVFKKIKGRFELVSDSQLKIVMNRTLIFSSMSEKKNEFFELELTGSLPN